MVFGITYPGAIIGSAGWQCDLIVGAVGEKV